MFSQSDNQADGKRKRLKLVVNYKSYPEAIKWHKKRALEIHLSARYSYWSGKRDSNPRLSAWEAARATRIYNVFDRLNIDKFSIW